MQPVPFRPGRRKSAVAARPPLAPPTFDRGARLRTAAWALLAVGAIGAALIYWTGRDSRSADELLPASAREHRRQMGILYGAVGGIAVDMSQALRDSDTQAWLVFGSGVIGALVCFRLARNT